jgi:hypothetical protein
LLWVCACVLPLREFFRGKIGDCFALLNQPILPLPSSTIVKSFNYIHAFDGHLQEFGIFFLGADFG